VDQFTIRDRCERCKQGILPERVFSALSKMKRKLRKVSAHSHGSQIDEDVAQQ
jgi:hypothetical protein